MKYALILGARAEASPKASGHCPACGSQVIAKCGPKRVNHWAHKSSVKCEYWWEPETQWHRNWKDWFPTDWQESIQIDSDGRKHIADIKSPTGIVVEFQHSPISRDERISREASYKNMIWVVNATRLRRMIRQLSGGLLDWHMNMEGQFKIALSNRFVTFPDDWAASSVPVIFDVGSDMMVCLWPHLFDGKTVYFNISRKTLVRLVSERESFVDMDRVFPLVREVMRKRPWELRNIDVSVIEAERMAIRIN